MIYRRVSPDDTVAVARRELHIDILEQDTFSELYVQIVNRYHILYTY